MSAFKIDVEVIGPNPRGKRGEAAAINANPRGTKLVYGAGKTLVVRDYANPSLCQIYNGHTKAVKVAKFNNSSSTIASCDEGGQMHMVEIKKSGLIELTKKMGVLGGPVLDVAWTAQDNKLYVGGEAKPSGRCLTLSGLDQGSVGESLKRLLSLDVRPVTKDVTAATGSYDGLVRIYKGNTPKFLKSIELVKGKKPVQCVRYSPDGKYIAASASKEIKLINAETGDVITSFPIEHKGSVYGLAWSKDSSTLMSSSADTTVKLYDVAANKMVTSFDCMTSGEKVNNFQVGCTFAGDNLVSMALSGNLLYLDKGSGKITNVVEAHTGPIASVAYDRSASDFSLYTIDNVGAMHVWNKEHHGKHLTGEDDKPLHSSPGTAVVIHKDRLYSSALDNMLKVSDGSGKLIEELKLPSSVKSYGMGDGVAVFGTSDKLFTVVDDKISGPFDAKKEITAIGVAPDNKEVIVATKDKMMHVYELSGGDLKATGKTVLSSALMNPITAIDVSNKYIAAGTKVKYVRLIDRATGERKDGNKMCFNTNQVSCVKISPDETKVASGGLDGCCYLYDVANPKSRISYENLHEGGISALVFIDNGTFYTAGSYDGSLKKNEVKA